MILSNYAIKFRTAVFVFIAVLVLAGAVSYVSLPREGTPDITIPQVYVTAVYEGTAPEEMEKLVTVQIEKQLNDVEGVKEIRSTSAENIASLVVEFMAGEDIEQAKRRVKDKVDLAKPDLPPDLDEPVVDAFNFSSDVPVYIFALSGSTDLDRLKILAEDLKDRLERLPGIQSADLAGIREREIRVEIDLPRMIAYRIPLGLVMGRIAQENVTVSAGNIEVAGDKFQVRIPGEFQRVPELREILLAERGGRPVYLTDIATISDTFKDLDSISRLNGAPCVSVSLKKRAGINAVRLIAQVEQVLAEAGLPPDVKLTEVMDMSYYIDMMIRELESNVATGFLLVVAVLLVFLGLRNAVFVGLAIPFSMLTAFTLMAVRGTTLNMIVLFSLVLAVGMLVDNAIVIVENIYRLRTEGLTRKEAARRGAGEVAWPVITSTLTTLVAFWPLTFWPDVMGQFMGFLPRTLIVVLTASLFVAMVINPAICSVFIQARPRDARETTHWFVAAYERVLRAALRHRLPVLLTGFAFLVLTVQIYAWRDLGIELFPETDPRNATVDIQFPQGTSIGRTDVALQDIERKLAGYPDVKFFLTTVGAQSSGMIYGGASATHQGSIYIEFLEPADRQTPSLQVVDAIRDDIGVIPGAEVKVKVEEGGPPTGEPVSIEISGDDFDVLEQTASDVQRAIETVPGLVDLQSDMEKALPEIRFHVDRHRAALLGLDTAEIGNFLRMAIYGIESSRFRADEDEYDITLRLPLAQRQTMNLLDQVFIPTPAGSAVPLSSLGSLEYTGGRGAIRRKGQKRVVTLTGNNQGRGVDKILADVQKRVAPVPLPRGYAIEYTGDTEEMRESGIFLMKAFAVAAGLIFVILVVQFNSAVLPVIIVFSILLSMIGVMWGLLLNHMRFGVVMTGVGLISLAGIVVNNAIVLIDCIRQRQADGLGIAEAVVAAGRLRLRPVLLTATTTILGLLPMALGYSLDIHTWPPSLAAGTETSAMWKPMAIAVIFGLAMATVLTLVLVPVMYSLAEGFAEALKRRLTPRDEADAAE
ncbi:MAG TPA: efflux RND transporter permease subunit [Kiritimatiellia bacterium]|nr:efflux RND transporter permease subunit [Kiritimatiellia bacterium]